MSDEDAKRKEIVERTKAVDAMAHAICAHGIAAVPAGHFVIVIVENGHKDPSRSAVAMRANIAPNPGVTAGDILRKVADSLDNGVEFERPHRGKPQ